MKLRARFTFSHGLVVAFSLAACLLLFRQGAAWMLARQEAADQRQMLSDFSQAAREAVFEHEDLGLIHAMRVQLNDPSLVFAAFANPASGARLVLPRSFAPEAWKGASDSGLPRRRVLADGLAVTDWALPLSPADRASAWVELAFSRRAVAALLRRQMRGWSALAGAVLLAGLLLGAAMAWLTARRLARPLQQISEGTRLVRSGRMDRLVEVDRADEIGDLARDFNGMVLQLKELDAMKRDFVAGVTHDFGSPLHAIRTTIDHLLSGQAGRLDDRQAEYLLMISNNLASLTAFVNNLLTVSRIEAAKVEPYPEPVDVLGHVGELTRLWEAQVRGKGVELVLTRRGPYISLEADLTMFRQIVMNLLSNAVKFTDHGRIEVVVGEEGGDFVLEVRDTGIGIDPRHHSLVFDKFFRVRQAEAADRRPGSGLGLSIVKGLAEAQGGVVELESEPGRGSIFRVRLPKQAARRPQPSGGEA